MTIPYTFAGSTGSIPLGYLDANFTYVGDSSGVVYTPAGTGAVATTVQSKLRQTVSVIDFLPSGYVTDGSVDYSTQVQAALTYCATNFKTLTLSGLTLKITTPLTVTCYAPGFGIEGENANLLWYTTGGICLSLTGYDFVVSNFSITNYGTVSNGTALYLRIRRSRVQNIKIFSGFAYAVDFQNTQETHIDQIHIENYRGDPTANRYGYGMRFASCLNVQLTNCFVAYCNTGIAQGTAVSGVAYGNEGLTFTDNTIIANNYNIYTITGLAFNISNNIIDLGTTQGVQIGGSEHIIHGNWIADDNSTTNTTFVNLDLTSASLTRVTDNTFIRGALAVGAGYTTGISTTNGLEFFIAGNVFSGNMVHAVNLNSYNYIGGNFAVNGAVLITPTGSLSNYSQVDSGARSYFQQGLNLGNASPSTIFTSWLTILAPDGNYNAHLLSSTGVTQVRSGLVNKTYTASFSSTDAAWYVAKDSTSNRSINAAGTVNASGADYAEYMVKANPLIVIAKGDICGIDVNGKLTTVFSDSISFVIKSTNPAYVGNDVFDTSENQKNKVDRIAFSGQVPVNITNFNVGNYIVPLATADNKITVAAIASASITFEQYRAAVGRIIAKQDDGRALVIVKVI